MQNQQDQLQYSQYEFPYHYIPSCTSSYLSRHWSFAASYMSAFKICSDHLPYLISDSLSWSHLDIGCGDGALIHHLTKSIRNSAIKFEGVDINPLAISWAKVFNSADQFSCSSLSDINKKYNSASLIEVLEHVDPRYLSSFVDDVANTLNDKGYLIVTVPSDQKPVAKKHYQHFNSASLAKILQTRFKIIKLCGFERYSALSFLAEKVRYNNIARIDSPYINNYLVESLSTLHPSINRCGRIFALCQQM